MKQCAFCGKPTNYFSYELNCYICIECLAKYKRAMQPKFKRPLDVIFKVAPWEEVRE